MKSFYSETGENPQDGNTVDVLAQYIAEQESLLLAIREVMQAELIKVNLPEKAELLPGSDQANYELRFDSYDKTTSLYGEWKDGDGYKCGSVLIHQGGQVFAEWDVVCPHPSDKRWFIESVTAWGKAGALGSELGLLEAVY